MSVKEEQIRELQQSQIDYEVQIAAQDAAIKKYQDLETSNLDLQRSLEEQLEQANTKANNLANEMSSKEEKHFESLQAVQAQLESLQKTSQLKEDECSSVRDQLSAANSAMSNLESAKTKAKAEIHSLLRRVQDSERWMKLVKETLEELGINTSDESFSDTWSRLNALLRAKTVQGNSPSFPAPGAAPNEIKPPASTVMSLTPRRDHGSPSGSYFQTTELIYRTQSIQSTFSSPGQRSQSEGCSRGRENPVPDSQAMTSIVPFSSIQNDLSPAQSFSQHEDPTELASMFMSTPKKQGFGSFCDPSEGFRPNLASKGDIAESPTQTDHGLTELLPAQRVAGGDNHGTKRKAVAFEGEMLPDEKRDELSGSLRGNGGESAQEGFTIERTAARLNQRTYGRSQHLTAEDTGKGPLKGDISLNEHEAASGIHPTGSHIPDKRAPGAASRPQRRTRRASDYFETKTSPTSLASGSSRRSSENGQRPNKSWARGPRRGGRRTRGRHPTVRRTYAESVGERYNARFNQ